jgi:mono/diheme cytochrome c family protein
MSETVMPRQRGPERRRWARASLLALLAAVLALAARPAGADDDFAGGRRIFLEKADCAYCHGWAGDGAGHPQSPGRAANLRKSGLDRDTLVTTILCGIPGTAMPHFDALAYTDKRCYGMTEAELGDRTPTLPPSTTLQRREVEVIADYLKAKVIGRSEVTRAECLEAFGADAGSCGDYPARP